MSPNVWFIPGKSMKIPAIKWMMPGGSPIFDDSIERRRGDGNFVASCDGDPETRIFFTVFLFLAKQMRMIINKYISII